MAAHLHYVGAGARAGAWLPSVPAQDYLESSDARASLVTASGRLYVPAYAAAMPDTSSGLGLAGNANVFAGMMTPTDETTYGVRTVWASQYPNTPTGVVNGYYYPFRSVGQDPTTWQYKTDDGTVGTLSWFVANHPSWLAYYLDPAHPADAPTIQRDFGLVGNVANLVPLDFAQTAVRDWVWTTYLLPALQAGYQMISFDNVLTYNSGPAPFVRAGYYSSPGVFVQRYNLTSVDAVYTADVLAFFADMAQRIHSYSAIAAMGVNFRFLTNGDADGLALLALIDLWLDEQTATNFGGTRLSGSDWLTHQTVTWNWAQTGAAFFVDSISGLANDAAITHDELNWVVGNYLMEKGSRSYVTLLAQADVGKVTNISRPEWATVQAVGTPTRDTYLTQGVYRRDFSGGCAIVNHTLGSVTYNLGTLTYHDLWGAPVSVSVVLPATTAAVLLY